MFSFPPLVSSLANTREVQAVETKLDIFYNENLGQFIFNDINVIDLEGKQKDTADCLVAHGKDKKVCWDEIHENFKDLTTDIDLPTPPELDARKRSVRTAVTEINNRARLYLKTKDLVNFKDNWYWLQYYVDTA